MTDSADTILNTRALVVGWSADDGSAIPHDSWVVVVDEAGNPLFDKQDGTLVVVDTQTGQRVAASDVESFYQDNASVYKNIPETTQNFVDFVNGKKPEFVGSAVAAYPVEGGNKQITTNDASLSSYAVVAENPASEQPSVDENVEPVAPADIPDAAPFGYSHSYTGSNRPDSIVAFLNPEWTDKSGVHENVMPENDETTDLAYLAPSQYGPWMEGYGTLDAQGLLYGDSSQDVTNTQPDGDTNSSRWESRYTKFWAPEFQAFMNDRAVEMVTARNFDGISFGTVNINSYELMTHKDVLQEYLASDAFAAYQSSPAYLQAAAEYTIDKSNETGKSFESVIGNTVDFDNFSTLPANVVQEARFGLYGANPDYQGYVDKYFPEQTFTSEQRSAALADLQKYAQGTSAEDGNDFYLQNWLVASGKATDLAEAAAIVADPAKLNPIVDAYVVEKMETAGIKYFDREVLLNAAGENLTPQQYEQLFWPNVNVLENALTDTLANSVLQQIEAAKQANPEAVISVHESLLPKVQSEETRQAIMSEVDRWQLDGSLFNMFDVQLSNGNVVSITPKDGDLLTPAQLQFVQDVQAAGGEVTVEPIVDLSAELLGISEDEFNKLTLEQRKAIQESVMEAFNDRGQYDRFVSEANAQGVVAIVQPMRNEEGKVVTNNIPEAGLVKEAAEANAVESNTKLFAEQYAASEIMPVAFRTKGLAAPAQIIVEDGTPVVEPEAPANELNGVESGAEAHKQEPASVTVGPVTLNWDKEHPIEFDQGVVDAFLAEKEAWIKENFGWNVDLNGDGEIGLLTPDNTDQLVSSKEKTRG